MKFTIELDREVDGRWIAGVPELNILLYGDSRQDAIQKSPSGNTRNRAGSDRSLRTARRFSERYLRPRRLSPRPSTKARRVSPALLRIGWRHDRTATFHQ